LETETFQTWLGFLSPEVGAASGGSEILRRSAPDPELDPPIQSFVRNLFLQCISVMEEPLRLVYRCLLMAQGDQMSL
jgi:hypothetical protein